MNPDTIIRPFQADDRQAIRAICYITGFMGEPADWYWRDFESFADIWTGYYTDREPQSTYVACRSGKVLGYLLGCIDINRSPSPDASFLQQLARRFLLVRPGTAGFFWRCALDLLRDGKIPASTLKDDRFPSHLHIDLLPEARGVGIGAALMHAWFDRLAVVGSPGCHLDTLAENTNGIAFFERMGFRCFGPPALLPGMRTHRCARMHEQTMVRETKTT